MKNYRGPSLMWFSLKRNPHYGTHISGNLSIDDWVLHSGMLLYLHLRDSKIFFYSAKLNKNFFWCLEKKIMIFKLELSTQNFHYDNVLNPLYMSGNWKPCYWGIGVISTCIARCIANSICQVPHKLESHCTLQIWNE